MDLNKIVLNQLKRQRPDPGNATGMFDVNLSSDGILSRVKYVLKVGLDPIDMLCGSFPIGRIIEIYGLEGCVVGDTEIDYVVGKGSKIQNAKGGTIEKLWHRFHGQVMPGQGHYQRPETVGSSFYISSINQEGMVFRQPIVDVVKTGIKPCFELKTAGGFRLNATGDHKIFNGTDYIPLENLAIGDRIMVHNNTHFKGRSVRERYADSIRVGCHYRPRIKKVGIYSYKFVCRHILTYEAKVNGYSLEAYLALLNSGITEYPNDLVQIPKGFHVHHRDNNKLNDHPDNLELLTGVEHNRHHAFEYHNKLRFTAVPDSVTSVVPIGDRETYDIKCPYPNNNYIANRIVVHNSGKSAICLRSAIKAQQVEIYERVRTDDGKVEDVKLNPNLVEVCTVFIDNEQSIDNDEKITIEGVTLDCVISRCDTVDQFFKMVDVIILKINQKQKEEIEEAKKEKREAKTYFVVVICDTIAGTSSKEEMTKDWSKEDFQRQPKQLREGFRTMQRDINRNNVLMICSNQVSEKFKKIVGRKPNNSNIPQEDDFSTFGGRALKYFASQRIFMYQVYENYKISQGKFSQGLLIGFFIKKNRIQKPLRTGRLVLLFDGGYSNDYSILETLLYLGLASISKTDKKITFLFSDYGIVPTTFKVASAEDSEKPRRRKSAGASLQEDDDRGRSSLIDPTLEFKKDWPAFRAEHKADFDLLWQKASEVAFNDNRDGIPEDLAVEDIDLDLDDE